MRGGTKERRCREIVDASRRNTNQQLRILPSSRHQFRQFIDSFNGDSSGEVDRGSRPPQSASTCFSCLPQEVTGPSLSPAPQGSESEGRNEERVGGEQTLATCPMPATAPQQNTIKHVPMGHRGRKGECEVSPSHSHSGPYAAPWHPWAAGPQCCAHTASGRKEVWGQRPPCEGPLGLGMAWAGHGWRRAARDRERRP